mgnify:CR=1 FL=1
MSDLLNKVAEILNAPVDLVQRSAEARAAASGISVDDVLSSWAGGESIAASEPKKEVVEEVIEETATEEVVEVMQEPEVDESKSFHQIIKEKFIEGGPGFMGIVLLCLILGLALSIERIIYLNLASQNTEKLVDDVESALSSGGVEAVSYTHLTLPTNREV